MGSLGEMSFGDIGRALGRYRPVVFTVGAIVVLLLVLPNHNTGGVEEASAASVGSSPLRAPVTPPSGATVAGADAGLTTATTVDTTPIGGPSAFGTIGAGGTAASASSYSSGSSFSSGSTSASSPAYAPAPVTSGADTGSGPMSSAGEAEPLRVIAAAWATNAGAGTPLASNGVPAGTLPVGSRLGSDDKRSYVRLSGSIATLILAEDTANSRAALNGTASVSACQIKAAGWPEAEGEAFADAPAYDDKACAVGSRADDGTWTFNLASFSGRTDGRGFALVPTPGGPVDFQVTFKR